MTTVQEIDTTTTIKTLSTDEQATFIAQAEKEVTRVMRELKQYFWERKPKMENLRSKSTHDRYISYRQPTIRQQVLRPEIGVLAFVTEEQIDHWANERQFQYYLYVFTFGSRESVPKIVDQGFVLAGGATIPILKVEQKLIVASTKHGEVTIVL